MDIISAAIGIIGVIVICVIFIVFLLAGMQLLENRLEAITAEEPPYAINKLTPTQKFILAASSPTIGNNYKCVIDIWETRNWPDKVQQVKDCFEWGWGELTYENAKESADKCLNELHNSKYKEYCMASSEAASRYTKFEIALFEEVKRNYPKQGILGWDLVRALSVVGGAYMGGVMEYGEASQIALKACRILQANFSSWDDMVGSYTLGYQLWRGKRSKDRLKYYKKLKQTAIYQISWDTVLKEEEL